MISNVALHKSKNGVLAPYWDSALIEKSASGAVASFSDGAEDVPMASVVADIEPIQDLHGYSNPWVGGSGKNRLPCDATTQTINGVTFTVNDDGTITANGTATASAFYDYGTFTYKATDTVILNGCPSGGGGSTYRVYANNKQSGWWDNGNGVTFPSITADEDVRIRIAVYNGYTANNLVFKPMIRLASVTDDTYAPYSNICPISGWDSVNVTRTGINIWDEEWEVGEISSSTGENVTGTATIRSTNYISVVPDTDYYIKGGDYGGRVFFYKLDKTYISYVDKNASNRVFTTPSDCYFIRFREPSVYGTTYNHDISINYPSTDTAYHAYNGKTYPTTLPQTVYGGSLDVVSGVLTIDRAMVDMGTLTWKRDTSGTFYANHTDSKQGRWDIICSCYLYNTANYQMANYSTYPDNSIGRNNSSQYYYVKDTAHVAMTGAEFAEYIAGQTLVYELATPQTIQLTPTEVDSLLADNVLFADSGNIAVTYRADSTLAYNQLTNAIVSLGGNV